MSPLDALLAHPDIARLAESLTARPGNKQAFVGPVRPAAIALVIRAGDTGHHELLMIKRAEAERDPWSGHIACPGGRMEPGDADLAETAIRETREETGVDLARDGRILGTLDDISPRTPALPPIIIRPFVAAVRPDVSIVPSDEVAEAFWVPLSALRETSAWGTGLVQIRGMAAREERVFRHGEYTVWGLTHRALSQLLEHLGRTG
jgi:8-oxo-dGTP pyrophosphatase MutT (NUDIX family)